MAILSTYEMIAQSFDIISKSKASEAVKISAISFLSEAIKKMVVGQYKEIITPKPNSEELFTINLCKTAELIKCACCLGALTAEESEFQPAVVYGTCFGLAYQLLDDLIDQDGYSLICSKDKCFELLLNYKNKCSLSHLGEKFQWLTKFAEDILAI